MPPDFLVRTRLELHEFNRRLALVPRREMPAKAYQVVAMGVRPWRYRGKRLAFQLRNLLTNGRPVPVELEDVSFSMVPDGAIAFDHWSRRRFERHELSFILRFVARGTTFLDVGANNGLFSLAVATRLKDSAGAVYAFEPCEATFDLLEANLRLNSLTRVHAVRLALCDYEGTGTLQVNVRFKDGLNTLGRPSHSDSEVVSQQTVPVTMLDSFLSSHGVERVDVMKVDVEGAERLVFRGARNLLMRPDAPLMLYEGYSSCTAGFGYHPVETMWLLEGFGYELFVLDSATGRVRRRTPGSSHDAMVVAAKPEHPRYQELQNGGESR